jgi:hypothetical protein
MKELTLADLMAIDYWKDQGYHDAVIASKLSMTTAQLQNAFCSFKLKWATDILNNTIRK